jgi:hypothetical protein
MKNLVKMHRINGVKIEIPGLTQEARWLAKAVTLFI